MVRGKILKLSLVSNTTPLYRQQYATQSISALPCYLSQLNDKSLVRKQTPNDVDEGEMEERVPRGDVMPDNGEHPVVIIRTIGYREITESAGCPTTTHSVQHNTSPKV